MRFTLLLFLFLNKGFTSVIRSVEAVIFTSFKVASFEEFY